MRWRICTSSPSRWDEKETLKAKRKRPGKNDIPGISGKQVNIGEEINLWKTLKLTVAFKITHNTL